MRHKLLVLDAPGLTEQQQLRFGMALGECQVHPTANLRDGKIPEIFWISNVDPATDTIVKPDLPVGAPPGRAFPDGGTLTWHTDSSHAARPSLFTLLFALEVPSPEAGGGTQFADTGAGFRSLSPALRDALLGKSARHSLEYSRALAHGRDPTEVYPPPVTHPIIRRHPETAEPTVYLGAHAAAVVGADGEVEQEARDLIDAANWSVTEGPHAVVHTHEWTVGQLLIWDNRSLLHRGLPVRKRILSLPLSLLNVAVACTIIDRCRTTTALFWSYLVRIDSCFQYDPRKHRRVMRRVVVLGDEKRDLPIAWTPPIDNEATTALRQT